MFFFFSKSAFLGRQTFSGKKFYGEVALNGRTNDQIIQGRGGVSQMINAFSSNLNTVNL